MNRVAIIPARSGSKGLKDKNIIDLCGKPLMAYSIEAAVDSGCFNQIIVSTDSTEYGKIAIEFGAEVLYRGENLSDDKATSFMVIEDVLKRIDNQIDYFVLLQPTSPLRHKNHIREAINSFENNFDRFDFLVSVKEAEHAKVLVNPIEDDLSMKNFDADFSNYRRQGFKDYSPNGAIFAGKPDAYRMQKHFFGAKSLAYIMNDVDSIDIDNMLDYELAKICMTKRIEGNL